MLANRKCPVCDGPLLGRTDRKYCSDQCRNKVNNRNKTRSEKVLASVNKVLRHNRNILHTLCPEGQTLVLRHVLDRLDFSFTNFTSMTILVDKEVEYICYDYRYLLCMDDDVQKILIAKLECPLDFDPWQYARTSNEQASLMMD